MIPLDRYDKIITNTYFVFLFVVFFVVFTLKFFILFAKSSSTSRLFTISSSCFIFSLFTIELISQTSWSFPTFTVVVGFIPSSPYATW